MENKTPNQPPINRPAESPKFNVSWIYGIIILLLIGSYFFNNAAPVKEVPYSTFEEYVKQGLVEKIDVYSTKIHFRPKSTKRQLKK